MICPDTNHDCDNPGCRRGGCQGRRPDLPLLRGLTGVVPATRPPREMALVGASAKAAQRALAPTLLPTQG